MEFERQIVIFYGVQETKIDSRKKKFLLLPNWRINSDQYNFASRSLQIVSTYNTLQNIFPIEYLYNTRTDLISQGWNLQGTKWWENQKDNKIVIAKIAISNNPEGIRVKYLRTVCTFNRRFIWKYKVKLWKTVFLREIVDLTDTLILCDTEGIIFNSENGLKINI